MTDFVWTDLENAVPGQPESGSTAVVEPLNAMGHEVERLEDDKVDKETGKGLSTEDYTTEEKAKLEGIEAGAEVNVVDSVAGKTGAVTLEKSDVGLSNVDNTADIDKPISTATQSALNAKASASDVTVIQGKIPNQATSENQLADKDFVNSSISTETAHYISDNGEPFTDVEDLPTDNSVTNNDYAFVTGTDTAGNTYYDRYKATVSGNAVTWAKEYRLNNSSFTAAQWAAISSGITSALVSKISANETAIESKLTEPSSGIAVGKYFRVASIDNDGHAVLEYVDAQPAWRKICDYTLEEDVANITINKDSNNEPFVLSRAVLQVISPVAAGLPSGGAISGYIRLNGDSINYGALIFGRSDYKTIARAEVITDDDFMTYAIISESSYPHGVSNIKSNLQICYGERAVNHKKITSLYMFAGTLHAGTRVIVWGIDK